MRTIIEACAWTVLRLYPNLSAGEVADSYARKLELGKQAKVELAYLVTGAVIATRGVK